MAILAQALLVQPAWADTWQTATSPQVPGYHLNGIWGSAAGDVYTVGATGSILHWNGTAWSLMTSPTTQELFGIWGSGASDIYAVGAAGTIIHYDGAAWTGMTSNTTQNLKRIWGSGPADIWAVGEGSTILHWNGSNWTNLNTAIAGNLSGIWGSAADNIYAVDESGRILRYNGFSWSIVHTASDLLYGIWGSGPEDIYAVGWNGSAGTIRHFDGTTWSFMASNTPAALYDVWGSGPADIYAVGTDYTGGDNDSAVLHFDGTTWSAMSSPENLALQAVWGSAANDVYAVSYQGTILYNGTARAMGSIAMEDAAVNANRYNGLATVVVTRTGGLVAGATVDYTTANGTGAAGVDYVATSGTLTFGLSETTRYIMVDLLPGATTGATFNLTLSSPAGGAALGALQTTTVTIIDGGTPPVLSLTHIGNSTNAVTFQVSLSRSVEWPVLADYATADGTAVAGADYTAIAGTLVILPGDTTGTIAVDLITNADAAAGKYVTVILSNAYGATLGSDRADGTIQPSQTGTIRCGSGVGAANMILFYALCWVGLAARKWGRIGKAK
jgi:hypothetical protein